MSSIRMVFVLIITVGLLGAIWEELPVLLKAQIIDSASKFDLKDQTFANLIYGLSLLGVQWEYLDSELKGCLLNALKSDQTFSVYVPQHIANTIWVNECKFSLL